MIPKRNRRAPIGSGAPVRTLVAVHQPGHRERHLQRVLEIVVGRVAFPVARVVAPEEPGAVAESAAQGFRGGIGIRAADRSG